MSVSFEFSATGSVDLFLDSFTSNGGSSSVTGFTLDLLSSGTATRLTTSTTNCFSAAGPVSGTCDLIAPFSGAATATKPSTTTAIFAGLAAGTYRVGIYDSATPDEGNIAFRMVDVTSVPLPSGGLLLMSGLGGVAALRRRNARKS